MFTLKKDDMDLYTYLDARLSCFDAGHSVKHVLQVAANGYEALRDFPHLEVYQRDAILLACLLHDLNDHKFTSKEEYISISELLLSFYPDLDRRIPPLVEEMIELVSCSSNGDSIIFPTWKVITRYADRIEAMGQIGLERAIAYSNHTKRPFISSSTLPARSLNELKIVASQERWKRYTQGSKTTEEDSSTMDHLYDKVVHINVPEWVESPFLIRVAKERREWLFDYIISYWNSSIPNTKED